MSITTNRTPPREIRTAAGDLASLLAIARTYLATTRPRVCCDCGHCFTVASLTSGRRCARCGIAQATTPELTAERP